MRITKENNGKTEKPKKFEYIFEDEDCTSIWKYDLNKQPNGPISVENKYTAKYLKEMELKKRRGR
jgi:hypothetical protein